MSIQLRRDASQRCFRDLVVACRGGGPSLTDERPNLLISRAKVEAGLGGGRVAALVMPGGGGGGGFVWAVNTSSQNGSTGCPLTVANKIKEPVRARARRKMGEEIRDG